MEVGRLHGGCGVEMVMEVVVMVIDDDGDGGGMVDSGV